MIKIHKLCRFLKLRQLPLTLCPQLTTRLSNNFTLTSKKSQLILHSQGEIEKLHNKKRKKEKTWQIFKQAQKNQLRVSLIGLPNSGKSSLFNCLIGERLAIVDKHPGMTRDRRQFQILQGLVKIIDTPGVQISAFGKHQQNNIKFDIFKQTVTAIHESHIIIVVIDSTKPISNQEIQMVKYLRKYSNTTNIILACSKSQKIFDQSSISEQISKLAIDKVFFCSGQNGSGVIQILQYIDSQIPQQSKQALQKIKKQRVQKFQQLIKTLKQQMQALQQKGINIKQWQHDFRKINPQLQLNSDLDHEQFEQFLLKPEKSFSNSRGAEIKNLKMKNSIKICFIGRPNVGKSSLINQILGEQRLVVSETPHTTRDSIPNKIMYKNRKIQLIDTAGLENHIIQKTQQQYIKKAQYSTMLHVKQSSVVVYVMDSYAAFKIQDFNFIRKVIEEGRPVVIAVNKWEAIKQEYKYKAKNYLYKQIDQNLGYTVHGHPIVFVSAKLNEGIDTMIDSVITAYDKWNTRISTGLLNNWLQKFKKLDNLPKDEQATLRINYLIQAKVRPPHFIFFVNNKKLFKDNYMRFVTENMAKQFKMDGIPFRLSLRSTNNKQNEKKTRRTRIQHKNPYTQKMQQLKKKYKNFGL